MKQAHEYEQEAEHELLQATRLLETTGVVGNPKMLLGVLSHIYKAQQVVVSFFSNYISKNKTQDYALVLDSFLEESLKHKLIEADEKKHFLSVHSIMQKYKESPVAFSRKESYVIATKDYDLSLLQVETMKNMLVSTKQVMNKVFGQ